VQVDEARRRLAGVLEAMGPEPDARGRLAADARTEAARAFARLGRSLGDHTVRAGQTPDARPSL
jgi:hypothetical protein